nr:HAMP domain-containing histidine kinase [Gammaproteobacteria bacterium]
MRWSGGDALTSPTPQQRLPSASKRLPLLLVGALLLAIIAVSGFTIALLQGQRAVLEEAVRKSEIEPVILLANRIEQTVLGDVRAAFRVLKNVPISDAYLSGRLRWMHQQFPEVERVLFLNENLQPLENQPPFERGKGALTIYPWLLQQLRMEHSRSSFSPHRIHSLVETTGGRSTLLVWQPIDDADERKGWLAISFDLAQIQREHIAPLLNYFRRSQSGKIRLQDAESTWVEGAVNWPVGRILPGWQLIFESDPQVTRERLRQMRLVTSGIAGAVLLAMLLATFVVWREIHRERTLLELRNRFIANVSHELKSPLTLIRMYTETLYLGRLSDEQRQQQYYRTILRESERLTHMVDNILDFARVSKGVPTYHLTATDIGRTVAQVLHDYQPHVSENGLQLTLQLQPDLPPVLHDSHGVTQILLNLIDNAIKHGGDGKVVVVNLERHDNQVQLKVRDRGARHCCGTTYKNKKTDPRDNANHSNWGGMGFGLALVRQIADAHHATFSLSSKPGQPGTEATVSFPIGDAVV